MCSGDQTLLTEVIQQYCLPVMMILKLGTNTKLSKKQKTNSDNLLTRKQNKSVN